MRILILEDNRPVQRLLQSRLEAAGHQVEAVSNGHQGFQLATSSAYDVIISDIQMPHWDGFKFIDAMAVICPQLPIIITTAALEDGEVAARLEACSNVVCVFGKPVDFEGLFARLASIIPQSHTSINKMARIVCTIGPACDTPETLGKMILAGMDVARLNFSHGSYEQHEQSLCAVREAEQVWDKPIAVLQDLSGPKIRTGAMENGAIRLKTGQTITIQSDPVQGSSQRFSTSMPGVVADLRAGDQILLDDGLLELHVLEDSGEEVLCEVVVGGILQSNKGINLPSTDLSLPSVTAKDWQDLDWGLEHSVDYVALSFVRTAEEVAAVRDHIHRAGKRNIKVIAKIERPEAVQNIREIIEVADGIMIARGDMGVELPVAKVPRIQERIIRLCWEQNVPVITATQMLDSMTTHARPTRAEVTDVSMAIKEGTDAVMLSQETATGVDPVNVVRTMAAIICEEERYTSSSAAHFQQLVSDSSLNPALAAAASLINISATLLLDPGGVMYPSLSKWNRKVPALLVTRSIHVARHSSLYNNLFPLIIREELRRDEMVQRSIDLAKEWGYLRTGDMIGVLEGSRLTSSGFQQLGAVQVVRVD
ncbi:pyruvate kinase [Desulfogranum mediterraneum]|uniref:pyruvate kinase n=1 Tax=Desulfogranum mediterraneum TaxID=160661 RepID=UPI0004234F5B|nr:pyruvate kinase [Desulfogranum mediterraneum]